MIRPDHNCVKKSTIYFRDKFRNIEYIVNKDNTVTIITDQPALYLRQNRLSFTVSVVEFEKMRFV